MIAWMRGLDSATEGHILVVCARCKTPYACLLCDSEPRLLYLVSVALVPHKMCLCVPGLGRPNIQASEWTQLGCNPLTSDFETTHWCKCLWNQLNSLGQVQSVLVPSSTA